MHISSRSPNRYQTNFEDMVEMINEDPNTRINWVLYSENIFPSQINAFNSEKTFRDEYDNLYCRRIDCKSRWL